MSSIDEIRAALQCSVSSCDCQRGILVHCPSHDDSHPSLSLIEREGRLLWHCFAGCDQNDVAAQLRRRGLLRKEGGGGYIYPPQPPQPRNPATDRVGCTLVQYAEAKRLDVEFLRSLGLSDVNYLSKTAVRIPYLAADGSEAAVRFRLSLNGANRFAWKRGAKPCLYGLNRLDEARREGYVIIAEGESDCHTLWSAGFPALGLPGAASWREERDAPQLAGIDTIYVIVEPDQGGEAVRSWVARSEIRHRVHLVRLGEHKDASDLYLADPSNFVHALKTALSQSVPWSEEERRAAEAAAAAAWQQCETLAMSDDILREFCESLASDGVAGEERAAQLLYLALCSRFLDRPVSVAVRGPSAAGKSHLVERVLRFFPPSAYYALTAMSERALAYSDEPLRHRFLVLYEAAGLRSEFASYLVRSLLSERRVRYETVEKTKDGLRPRLIEREGPTGLIVTTTATNLHPENETRMIAVTLDDSPEQTRHVLLAQSEDRHVGDYARWHALQDWLAVAEHRVVVTFARALAEAIPPVAVRLRRDFGAVLALIRAHAILHQASRERDGDGRIVASLRDYEAVRQLVADIIADGIEASVSPSVRETVAAVAALVEEHGEPVTVSQVAQRLNLDKSTALRRVRVAASRGYVRNLEDRRGLSAKLVIGDPLPDEVDILPTPDRLAAATAASHSADTLFLLTCACGAEATQFDPDGTPVCDRCAVRKDEEVREWRF